MTKQDAIDATEALSKGLKEVLKTDTIRFYLTGDYFWIGFDEDLNRFNLDPDTLELCYFSYDGLFDNFHNNLMDCRDYIRRHRRDFDKVVWSLKHPDKLKDKVDEE